MSNIPFLSLTKSQFLVQDSYRKERKLALRHRELDHLGALFSTILTSDSGHSETAAVKPTEESSGEASESGEGEGVDGEGGEEAGGEIINNKIWEEIESMPQEFETFKEKWKKSNDSDIEAVSTLSSTLDQMKERLASMQVQTRPIITAGNGECEHKTNLLFSGAAEGARPSRVFKAGRHWRSGGD